MGIISLWGIAARFVETRSKQTQVSLDLLGVATLTTSVLALLFAFLIGGRTFAWTSPPILGLLVLSAVGTAAFIRAEKRARAPILSIGFFRYRGFTTGNAAVFLSSMAIFSLFAFAPLFIQGAQGKSPLQVGITMLSLSLGWSMSSLALGQVIDRMGYKPAALSGAVCLVAGCAMTLSFTPNSTVIYSFTTFFVVGVGMGFVALSTLLVVQSCLDDKDLGVATASNQFARTMGGAVGVGVCGGFIATRFALLNQSIRQSGILAHLPANLGESGAGQVERLLSPEIQALLPADLRQMLHQAVVQGVRQVFWTVLAAASLCLLLCLFMPGNRASSR